MKRKTKNILRGLVRHFGLKIVYVSYFPPHIYGKLLPREKRILVNAHKPRYEHIFTLLHELGHYLQHFLTPRRTFHPGIIDRQFKSDLLAKLASRVRRHYRFAFNNTRGKEWEADLWAMCAFIYLARHIGCREELWAFVDRHPEKRNVFLLAAGATVYSWIKTSLQSVSQWLFLPIGITLP